MFVDAAVERVSCDFLLPTLCEMDEHVNLSVDFLKSEFIYAIAAAVVGILLIVLVRICLWISSRQKQKVFKVKIDLFSYYPFSIL